MYARTYKYRESDIEFSVTAPKTKSAGSECFVLKRVDGRTLKNYRVVGIDDMHAALLAARLCEQVILDHRSDLGEDFLLPGSGLDLGLLDPMPDLGLPDPSSE